MEQIKTNKLKGGQIMKSVNLVNIKVQENNFINVEVLYKVDKDLIDIKAYLQDEDNKYYFDIKKYHFSDDRYYFKFLLDIKLEKNTKLKFVIEENNKKYSQIKFLDNKDEKISQLPICYKIFTKNNIVTVDDENGIFIVSKRKKGDKLKYEITKTIKAKKIFHKWYILNFFKTKEKYYLLNDRLMYGDDNAEQLFRYINETDKKMKKNSFFVLDEESPNYKELKKIGKVLKYGSLRHKLKFLNSKMIISSHASYYDRVFNPFNEQEMSVYKTNINKQFVFLQHGVIMNDVHNILNRLHILADLFITSTLDEYEHIKEKYMYDEKSIVCTGLSRFDKLKNDKKNIILIAPTWRAFLTDVEYTDNCCNSLEDSEFYKKYQSLLERKDLKNIIKEKNYKIQFLLHPSFEEYKESFINLQDELIEVLSTKDVKYSTLFKECALFITDYSSTHFDVAFLKKPIIYYQFDQEKFFKSHYQKGYFDYGKDGFGKLITEEDELVNKIIYYINNNLKIEDEYEKIINRTFKYLDHNNSKRILDEIKNIEQKNEKNYRFNIVH